MVSSALGFKTKLDPHCLSLREKISSKQPTNSNYGQNDVPSYRRFQGVVHLFPIILSRWVEGRLTSVRSVYRKIDIYVVARPKDGINTSAMYNVLDHRVHEAFHDSDTISTQIVLINWNSHRSSFSRWSCRSVYRRQDVCVAKVILWILSSCTYWWENTPPILG